MKSYIQALCVMFVIGVAVVMPALADEATTQNTEAKAVDISADESLEWYRNEQYFIAKGNAKAVQGDVSIDADTLKADYDNDPDGKEGSLNLRVLHAIDNVLIKSADNVAYGDKADYDLQTKQALMTGSNLKLQTPEQTITARDRFEYDVTKGKLVAVGNAKVVRPSDTLSADTITAYMAEDSQGKRTVRKVEADGSVTIITAQEKVTGRSGVYDAVAQTVEVSGNVVIYRGSNILRGQRAEVDLNTQISRLFGGEGETGRVTGTFYPDDVKQNAP